MKKVSLFLVLGAMSLIYFSCSDENNPATQDTTTVKFASRENSGLDESEMRDAISLYSAMIVTTEYADFATSISNFNEKLLGNETEAVTKTEWMDWIGRNISSTSFSSISEFEGMYDDSANKLAVVSRQNTGLFSYLDNANPRQISVIILPPVTDPVSTSSCVDDCTAIYTVGLRAAIEKYNRTVGAALESGLFSAAGITIWAAQGEYKTTEALLQTRFRACIGRC